MNKSTDTPGDGKIRDGTVTAEPFEQIFQYWKDQQNRLDWNCIFMLPGWLKAWRSTVGRERESFIWTVRWQDRLAGVVPLVRDGETVRLMGDHDVCDYGDFITVPGMEEKFFSILFARLKQEGISRFDAGLLGEHSSLLSFRTHAGSLGCEISCEPGEAVYVRYLPDTWEGFLSSLSRKERHEIRRKMRRLSDAGKVTFRLVSGGEEVRKSMDIFIDLFRMNIPEKSRFMNAGRETFFRALAEEMAGAGILRLYVLEIDKQPVASAMCLDYRSTVFLYNNGYDGRFSRLSVGLLCKVLSIRDSIERGRKRYDFLRGGEQYKLRLEGTPSQLVHCQVIL